MHNISLVYHKVIHFFFNLRSSCSARHVVRKVVDSSGQHSSIHIFFFFSIWAKLVCSPVTLTKSTIFFRLECEPHSFSFSFSHFGLICARMFEWVEQVCRFWYLDPKVIGTYIYVWYFEAMEGASRGLQCPVLSWKFMVCW